MANRLFEEIGMNQSQFINELNNLKKQGGDPNQIIQNLLNSGRVSQAQFNSAAQKAQQIMQVLPLGGRR